MKFNRICSYVLSANALFILTSCGDSEDSKKDNGNNNYSNSESYTYEFEYNGCNTGKHKFNSKEALCDGLKSQSLNDYCALPLREEAFNNKGCSGTFSAEN